MDNYRFPVSVAVIIMLTALLSCSDDYLLDEYMDKYGSSLSEVENERVSNFTIPHIWEALSGNEEEIMIRISGTRPELGVFNLQSKITRITKNKTKVAMSIPHNINIPDGIYIMQASKGKWKARKLLRVLLEDERISSVSQVEDHYSSMKYDSSTNAYTISNASEFKDFLYCLSKDPDSGNGRVFSQTADIDWNDLKQSLGTELNKRTDFAGIYEGNGNSIINISYSGSFSPSDDIYVGLFRSLGSGAEIRSLTLRTSSGLSNINTYGGLLAGKASGSIVIKKVDIVCTIDSDGDNNGNRLGGLIGYVEGATMKLDSISFGVKIKNAGIHIGGLLGYVENSTIDISNVQTPDYEIDLYAKANVGGLIGTVKNSRFNIRNILLNHASTQEMTGFYMIEALLYNAGGIIGNIESLSGASEIVQADVRTPVGGKVTEEDKRENRINYVGGLIGYANLTDRLTLNRTFIGANVQGNRNVGGYIGKCIIGGDNFLHFADINKIVSQNGSFVSVQGNEYTGGLIGDIEGNGKKFVFDANADNCNVSIMANVITTGNYTGGYFGKVSDCQIELKSKNVVSISSSAKVSSTGNIVGGFAGYIENSSVHSVNGFDFKGSIPEFSSFSPDINVKVSGNDYVGGVFGYANNTSISGICANTDVGGTRYVGGLFGSVLFANDLKIIDCTHSGSVNGSDYIGGIAGYCSNNGRFQDCINYGKVGSGSNVGGIVGKVDYSMEPPYVYYCVNIGDVTGTGDTGGIVGYMDGQEECGSVTKISSCANYGTVTSSGGGSNGTGGILGRCVQKKAAIIYCANHGDVSGTTGRIGGIVGRMGKDPSGVFEKNNLEIGCCANFGNISTSNHDAYVGGISGYNEEGAEGNYSHSYLHDCYNCGVIESDTSDDTGGLLGCADNYSATVNCINYGTVKYGNVAVGTRKGAAIIDVVNIYFLDGTGSLWKVDDDNRFTTSTMSRQEEFSRLDFNNIWKIGTSPFSGTGHPILQNCPFQNITF